MTVEPHILWMPGGVRAAVHLNGEQTGGRFCLIVDSLPSGYSLPAHRHPAADETIHVLHGKLHVDLEGEHMELLPGQTVHVPRGAVHATSNAAAGMTKRLILFSPAGMERFFLEVGASEPDVVKVDSRAVAAAAARHGWEFLGR